MSDNFLQQLYADGVSKNDFKPKNDFYLSCGECMVFFTKDQLPNLLQCGHFCCDLCIKQPSPCVICNKAKILKLPKYSKLINNTNVQKTFNFSIRSLKKNSVLTFQNISEDMTFGELLNKFPDFEDYSRQMKGGLAIAIQNKTYMYSEIKDKKISEKKEFFKITRPNESILIQLVNRYLGGDIIKN